MPICHAALIVLSVSVLPNGQQQECELLDVISPREPVVAQDVAVVPEFLDDAVGGHTSWNGLCILSGTIGRGRIRYLVLQVLARTIPETGTLDLRLATRF